MFVVEVLVALLCFASLTAGFVAWRNTRRLPQLADQPSGPLDRWPRVSLIIPARDEADTIGPALASRLADDYPDLQVIVVDDRSTDETAAIVERTAAGDPRVRLVRVSDLSDGWLGKVNALAKGTAIATGEYLLFSDADVHVDAGALRRAVAYCEMQGVDSIALLPDYTTPSFAVNAIWTVFMRALLLTIDPRAVADPRSNAALGSGGFTLVRREAFDKTPGFEWIKLETADDMAMGMMLKRSGARIRAMRGRGWVRVSLYRTIGAFLRGVEKNGATTAAHPLRFTLGMALFAAVEYAPIAALAIGPVWLRAVGGAALVFATATNMRTLAANSGRWVPALAWPVGTALFTLGTLRATWLARARGGVLWRGTLYPLEDISAARRFEF